MEYLISLHSEIGSAKENEDCLLERRASDGKAFVLVVADGLGGHGGGAHASHLAAHTIAEGFLHSPSLSLEFLTHLFCEANRSILSEQKGARRMKSTGAALFCLKGKLAAGYIGDTRIYQFRNGQILYQSRDHSVPQMEVDAGEITQGEIRFHPDRNRLLRALGEKVCRPEIFHLGPVCKGDAFLLCTDGFWEQIEEKTMLELLESTKTAEEWIDRMYGAILQGPRKISDNCSAAAVLVTE